MFMFIGPLKIDNFASQSNFMMHSQSRLKQHGVAAGAEAHGAGPIAGLPSAA
jgi:hypothetical protein